MRDLQPGHIIRIQVNGGDEFTMLFSEDLNHIMEQAKMRAVDAQGPDDKERALPPSDGS